MKKFVFCDLIMEYEIKGWPGYYLFIGENEIKVFSSWQIGLGKPKRGDTRESRILDSKRKELSLRMNKNGYLRVDLSKGKAGKRQVFLHRLIAETLIPNPNNLECVDHIDGNKTNNYPSNLQWITRGNNVIKAQKMGRWGTPPKSYKITYDNRKEEIIYNISKFSRENNYQVSKLVAVSKNKRKRHKDIISVITL